jgi:dGTPase
MSVFVNPLTAKKYRERVISRKEDIRGPFFRDQTAILHSLPFRRLKHKAQVFFSPNNDHVCTRIEHALHVATIAETIARGLDLNGEITYAIGLGHDLGHAPFGHPGETALDNCTKDVGGFIHEMHSLRVVDILGNHGEGLNLTYVVRDGIICHCGEKLDKEISPRKDKKDLATIKKRDTYPCSYEGCVARMADRIAYLGRDLEDAIYGGFIKESKVPKIVRKELGVKNGRIIDTLVIDVIKTSRRKGKIALSDKYYNVLMTLYDFSIKHIYKHDNLVHYEVYCERIIKSLFEYLMNLIDRNGWDLDKYSNTHFLLDKRFKGYLSGMQKVYKKNKDSNMVIVRDYIAGMTDGHALRCMGEISLPDELNFDKL